MASTKDKLLISSIIIATIVGAGINIHKNLSIDRSKLPEKVELSNGFQRWINNLKNNDMEYIDADEFRLLEENEIYNVKWMKVFSYDDEEARKNLESELTTLKGVKKVVFSPSGRLFVDYRMEERRGYGMNEVHFYGVRDDKIIDSRIVECKLAYNCYYDRAYFLNNDVFVVSEFSLKQDKNTTPSPCPIDQVCTYSIKLHLVDLVNNKRWIYESEPFDINLELLKKEL